MIHQISLNDCLEPTAPPERVLNISALDDVAFVRICSVKQDHKSETHTEQVADISVSLPSLLEALTVLINDQEREHLRPFDHDGKSKETRIAGERLSLAPIGFNSVAGGRTLHRRYTAPPEAPAEDTATIPKRQD